MLTELLYVLALSRRTQFMLIVGVAFFAGLMIGGEYATSHMELKSLPGPLADVMRDKIPHRYDKAAWAVLGISVLAAVKCYRKDRKRLGF